MNVQATKANKVDETTGMSPQELSAQHDARNLLVLISKGTQKVSDRSCGTPGYRIRKEKYERIAIVVDQSTILRCVCSCESSMSLL